MNFWWILVIALVAISLIIGILGFLKDSELIVKIFGYIIGITIFLCIFCTYKTITVKSEGLRQIQERNQIEYQIEHLTDDKDKIKLNEWILTYNDWVNDVNTSKELYCIFSWYYDFDMSQHTIIDLV